MPRAGDARAAPGAPSGAVLARMCPTAPAEAETRERILPSGTVPVVPAQALSSAPLGSLRVPQQQLQPNSPSAPKQPPEGSVPRSRCEATQPDALLGARQNPAGFLRSPASRPHRGCSPTAAVPGRAGAAPAPAARASQHGEPNEETPSALRTSFCSDISHRFIFTPRCHAPAGGRQALAGSMTQGVPLQPQILQIGSKPRYSHRPTPLCLIPPS